MARFQTHLSLILALFFSWVSQAQYARISRAPDLDAPLVFRAVPPLATPSQQLNRGLTAAAIGTEAAALAGLSVLWYSDYERSNFHFYDDASNWMGMDKWGHAYSSYQLTRLLNEVFSVPAVASRRPLLKSALFSASFLTSIEILDGFSSGWGFSWADMGANSVGLMLGAGQELLWKEQRMMMKFSYRPSIYAELRPETLGETAAERLFKDYNAQQYWITYTGTHSRTSGKKSPWWQVLRPSLGWGAGGLLAGAPDHPIYGVDGSPQPHRRLLLSLDVDWRRIHARRPWVNGVLRVLESIKFPAPAIVYLPSSGTIQLAPIYF